MATKNRCDCPVPPGGEIECDPDQAAFCLVDEHGNFRGLCLELPPSISSLIAARSRQRVVAWLFHEMSARLDPILARVGIQERRSFGRAVLPIGPLSVQTVFFDFRSVGRRLGLRWPRSSGLEPLRFGRAGSSEGLATGAGAIGAAGLAPVKRLRREA